MSKCDDCNGACCRFVRIAVPRMPPDERRWAEMRGVITGNRFRIRSKCSNLGDDGRCKIYKSRPQVCAEYKCGGEMCLEARKAAGVDETTERETNDS